MNLRPLGRGTSALRARILAACFVVVATTIVAVAYELLRQRATVSALPALALFYGGTSGIITAFAVWTAGDVGLPSLLVLSRLPARERWVRWLGLGVGLGILLAAASVALSSGAGSAMRPWFWERIQTPLGTVVLSARAALLEETFFRLFLIPFLVSIVVRARPARHRLRLVDGSARAVRNDADPGMLVLLAAVLVSSAMFGLAHVFNPAAAAMLAPMLAVAYLWGGWESAVTAHFVADMILFSWYY